LCFFCGQGCGQYFSVCFWSFVLVYLKRFLFSSFVHFFNGSLIWGEFSFLSSVYILSIKHLSDLQLAKIFS
jgi:hypothetical protein